MKLFKHKHRFVIPAYYAVKQNHRNTQGNYVNTTALELKTLMCECGEKLELEQDNGE